MSMNDHMESLGHRGTFGYNGGMKQLPVFITGNQSKADYLSRQLGVELAHQKVDLDELQSTDLHTIVAHKLQQAYDVVKQPVLVEDVSLAYFGCHTDITIPYDELGSIRTIDDDGEMTSIIEDGRFVLQGTEALNEPFED